MSALKAMKRITTGIILALLLSVLFGARAHATTTTAASCSASDVQTAINNAGTGDIVTVPGGSCTWTSSVSIPSSKGITLNGGGNTTITWGSGGQFVVTAGTTASSFVTGFTFVGSFNGNGPMWLTTSDSPLTQPIRFYNNTLDDGNPAVQGTIINTFGNGPLLIDHNTFTSHHGADEVIHLVGLGGGVTTGWATDVVPGGPNMHFIEDNTFSYPSVSGSWDGTSAVQSYYGARLVFRHNYVTDEQVDVHGTCGMVNGRWFEVYGNTFNVTGVAEANYVVLRGGSGVVWGNTMTGTNTVPGSIQVAQDCTSGTYPLPGQVGRGLNYNLSPVYIWGNDPNISISNRNPTYITLNTDYFTSTSQPTTMNRCLSAADVSAGCPVAYSYVSYPYPHPLIAATPAIPTTAATPSPTNFKATPQ